RNPCSVVRGTGRPGRRRAPPPDEPSPVPPRRKNRLVTTTSSPVQTDPLFDVRDKAVLITGGSRGLGLQMAHAFAVRGATVIIASRKLPACEEVAADLRYTYGVDAGAYACNVSDWSQCDDLMDAVHERYGQLDVLDNNAGLSPLYPS